MSIGAKLRASEPPYDFGAAGILGGLLVASHFVAREWVALVVGGVASIWAIVHYWDDDIARDDRRIASAITKGMFIAAALAVTILLVGVAPLIVLVALVGAFYAVRARARVKAPALPDAGVATGRVMSEGKAFGLGSATKVPGTNIDAVLWVARQGARRWSSTARIEQRGAKRSVHIDPAKVEFASDAWVQSGAHTLREAAAELDGVDVDKPVSFWYLREGTHHLVTGTARIERDLSAESLRDPASVVVFDGDVMLTDTFQRLLLEETRWRLVVAGVLGAGAMAASIGNLLGHW